MRFYEIEFPLAGLGPDDVETALAASGAQSVTFLGGGDEAVLEPRPGEFRLWGDTLVRALFAADGDAPDVGPTATLSRLAAALGPHITSTARVRAVADRVWERVWLEGWKSMRFGEHLWVCPTTAAPPDDPGAVVLRLDPGLAFGTGTHPTTALCLEALAGMHWGGRSLLDYGCGSGILALAALKLGAASATGVDLDPQALLASRENARLNGVADRLVLQHAGAALQPADCVVANILAAPLIELAPRIGAACRPGGDLLLSGVLSDQAGAVAAAYAGRFDMVRTVHREDWCCLQARCRPISGDGGAV